MKPLPQTAGCCPSKGQHPKTFCISLLTLISIYCFCLSAPSAEISEGDRHNSMNTIQADGKIHFALSRGVKYASAAVLLLFATMTGAQTLSPVPHFPLAQGPLRIQRPVQPRYPFTVAGENGAILGEQSGRFEFWSFPTKVFNDFHISADLAGYGVPIDLNQHAAEIDVQPDHTTITYSHAAIVVKQHMFTARSGAARGLGAVVFFEISSSMPATLTFEFEPSLVQMWPSPQYGRPSASWINFSGGGGYLLTNDNPKSYALVAMPGSTAGEIAPYQEHPLDRPLQFKLNFDPKRDSKSYFPLLVALSDAKTELSNAAIQELQQQIAAENNNIAQNYGQTQDYYAHFFDTKVTAETPDKKLNEALRWAEVAIEQTKVKHNEETGLVAGWYPAFASARPGFGWYFGRDTLWSLYAIDSYGDRTLAKEALEFLARRQRADGKIMHEFSQTADLVDWASLPYEYAAADATPLFIMAMEDYLHTTGDLEFLKTHWEEIKKAYNFDRQHDSDGDGVYDNSQGTGWVEDWPPKLPHQEIYLAGLDLQSTQALSRLAQTLGDTVLASSAETQARLIASRLNDYRTSSGIYSFSKNQDGSFDTTPSIFPSVAWWTRGSQLNDASAMFHAWAGHLFSTDWGTRSISEDTKRYNPITYHQGSVWPLYTGWVSLSEYRTGYSLSGYTHLMQNADLTWTQDPGYVTEVISGQYFEPMGRSSSHQLWSSAMVLSPAIRGLFGLEADALHHTLHVEPHLPAQWSTAKLQHVPVGSDTVEISYERKGNQLLIDAVSPKETVLCLNAPEGKDCGEKPQTHHRLTLPLPGVEIGIVYKQPTFGSMTQELKVLDQQSTSNSISLKLEAMGGSTQQLYLRKNSAKTVAVEGARQEGESIIVDLPQGEGYQNQTVTVRWK